MGKLFKDNKGFTLIELVVVIVILAILIGVSIAGYSKYIGQSKVNTDVQNAETIKSVLVNAQAEEGVYEQLKAASAGQTLVITVTNENMTLTNGISDIESEHPYLDAVLSQLQLDGDGPWTTMKTQAKGGEFTVTATIPGESGETGNGSVKVTVNSSSAVYDGTALDNPASGGGAEPPAGG